MNDDTRMATWTDHAKARLDDIDTEREDLVSARAQHQKAAKELTQALAALAVEERRCRVALGLTVARSTKAEAEGEDATETEPDTAQPKEDG